LLYWLLAREVLRLRAAIGRADAWPVAVELFVYRDPEEAEKEAKAALEAADQAGEAGEAPATDDAPVDVVAGAQPAAGEQWAARPAAAGWSANNQS
jgi:small subunit ribosomal protein SAe